MFTNINNFIKKHKLILIILILLIFLSIVYIYSEGKFDKDTNQSDITDDSLSLQIDENSYIEQQLPDIYNYTITSINVYFSYSKQPSGKLMAELKENDKAIYTWDIQTQTLKKDNYYSFELSKPFNPDNTALYSFVLTNYEPGNENPLCIYADNYNDSSHYIYNNITTPGKIMLTYTYSNVSTRIKYLTVFAILLLILATLLLLNVDDMIIMSSTLFALLSIYMLICPLGMAPDEINHFFRAYEIANVSLVSKPMGGIGVGGNYLPKAIEDYNNFNSWIDENDTKEIYFGNTALYSPVSYLPQAIGIKLAGLVTNNVQKIFYGGKLVNAVCCFILCILALHYIPIGKKLLFIIMIFPMSLQEMVSLAPDGLTISLSLFMISYIFHLSYTKERITNIDMIILFTSSLIISLCKIVYVTLLLLLFIIPSSKFKTKKVYYTFTLSTIGISGIANLIWLKISSGFLVEFTPGVNSFEQVKYILRNPVTYIVISIRTTLKFLNDWIATMVGARLGALNIITCPLIWIILTYMLVYYTFYGDNTKIIYRKKDLYILLSIFLCCTILIYTSLYVQWTSLKNVIIEGIQGRYFIPILPTLLFFLMLKKQPNRSNTTIIDTSKSAIFYYFVILTSNELALLDMIKYYIDTIIWR